MPDAAQTAKVKFAKPPRFLCALVAPLVLAALWSSHILAAKNTPPNIIVFLADDMGWNSLGCYGSDLHQTPNIDRLAKEGVRFTNGYSACTVCSPSRAAIMTGKWPARLNLTDFIPIESPARKDMWENEKLSQPEWTKLLPLSETTLAEALREAGYATAHVGKWHLGPPSNYPEHQGFDVNVAGIDRGSPPGGYFLPNELDLPKANEGDYLTDELGLRAEEIVRDFAANKKPFFLYFSFYSVHTPIQAKKEIYEKYVELIKQRGEGEFSHSNAYYAAMHESLDTAAGRTLQALDELGQAGNSLVIFTADNGGLNHKTNGPTGITLNDPLRAGKGSVYEGGVRVPFIVRWPGVAPAGAVSDTPIWGGDIYPTALAAAGLNREEIPKNDARNITPIIKNPSKKQQTRSLFWHYPHYHPGRATPYSAMREGPWRLIESYETGKVELYNLDEDLGEMSDVSIKQPEKVQSMLKKLNAWRKRVKAQKPLPNPNHKPGAPKDERLTRKNRGEVGVVK